MLVWLTAVLSQDPQSRVLSLQNQTNQLLADLKTKVVDLERATREADKMRRIEFALQALDTMNVVLPSYSEKDPYSLFRNILLSFRRSSGHPLGSLFLFPNGGCNRNNQDLYLDFQVEVSETLHRLLGKRPRLERRSDDDVLIHYD